MRTAPSFCLDAPTSRLWRRGLLGIWSATAVVLASWLFIAWRNSDLDTARSLTAGLSAVVWLWARPAKPVLHLTLTWDGHGWHCHNAAIHPATHADPQPCELGVAIDLGAWLLLRLRPIAQGPSWRRRVRWVALLESDVGPTWHSLRCALYSARRMTVPEPALTPPPAENRPLPR